MSKENGNGHKPGYPQSFVDSDALERMAESLEAEPGCASCSAPVGSTVAFCGNCGLKNPGFSEEEFKVDFGKNLEEIQKEEQCDSGHGPAVEDENRHAFYCIYCGKNIS